MNTRRYPRTLREAFPRDADYAASVEHYRRPFYDVTSPGQRFVTGFCAVGIVVVVWLIALGWL